MLDDQFPVKQNWKSMSENGYIQITGLKDFYDKDREQLRKSRSYFPRQNEELELESHQEMFEDLEDVLEKFTEKERTNLFYTAANCTGRNDFLFQESIAFDIDDVDYEKIKEYHPLILGLLGTTLANTYAVKTGHGLQYIIPLDYKIKSPEWFKKNRIYYKAICSKIDKTLKHHGLPGNADTAIFDARRILRLPGTWNVKPGKDKAWCEVLNRYAVKHSLDLAKLAEMPAIDASHYVPKKEYSGFAPPDNETILDECEFLKECQRDAAKLPEPKWHAMLGIVARMNNGRNLAHEFSAPYEGYSAAETDAKIDHVLTTTGPRTCESIRGLSDACSSCPHNNKIKSPLSIRGRNFIATENTGFHNVSSSGSRSPNYEDLRKFFERLHRYVTVRSTGMVYIWNKTQWEVIHDPEIANFAYKHFDPLPRSNVRTEFKRLILETNLVDQDWFNDANENMMNFKNGVLDLKTMKLGPHDPDFGFLNTLEYDYDPNAKCPMFDKYLDTVMMEREELKQSLLEFGGFVVANGDPRIYEKALILYGDGENGKTKFMDLVMWCVGSHNYSAMPLRDIGDPALRYQMHGKLVNIVEESPRKLTQSEDLKSLISGGVNTMKVLYKGTITTPNRVKFIFSCNELPTSGDTTHGWFRKLMIIPFDRTFDKDDPDRDPLIGMKMRSELPGILNKFIEAYKNLEKRKFFEEGKHSRDLKEQYRIETDSIYAWSKECIEPGMPEDTYSLDLLFKEYQTYCLASGNKPFSNKRFINKLARVLPTSNYPRIRRRDLHGKLQTYIGGIMVNRANLADNIHHM